MSLFEPRTKDDLTFCNKYPYTYFTQAWKETLSRCRRMQVKLYKIWDVISSEITCFCVFNVHISWYVCCFHYFLSSTGTAERSHNIRTTDFGFGPHPSTSPANNKPHLLGPDSKGWKYQPRPNSSNLFARSCNQVGFLQNHKTTRIQPSIVRC